MAAGSDATECNGCIAFALLSGLALVCAYRKRLNIREADIKLVKAGGRKVAGVVLNGNIDEFENFGLNEIAVSQLMTSNRCMAFDDAERGVQHDTPGGEGFTRAE
jgi:hypothetical protein